VSGRTLAGIGFGDVHLAEARIANQATLNKASEDAKRLLVTEAQYR
jgi:hypothetical protein